MSEQAAPQEGKPAEPQEGEGTEPQAGEGSRKLQLSPEAEAELKATRAEAAKYRKRAQELEAKFQADEEAKLSEVEKLAKAKAEAEAAAAEADARAKKAEARAAITAAAQAAGVNAKLAAKLIGIEDLEFDANGAPTNTEEAVAELIKQYPQIRTGSSTVTPTNPAREQTGALTVEAIKNMSAEEINARWDEVSKVMAAKK